MIRINLCPLDELESEYWYVPDLACAAAIMLLSFFGAHYYLSSIQDKIDVAYEQTESLKSNTQKLQPELQRFKTLDKDIQELNGKLSALKSITVSKVSKYKPVVVLEHLQSLKPDGVWFSDIKIGVSREAPTPQNDGGAGGGDVNQSWDDFIITGQSFDNLLTAEFITAVRATSSQEAENSDLRTQVYFDDLVLQNAAIPGRPPVSFPELSDMPEFTLIGKIKERAPQEFLKPKDTVSTVKSHKLKLSKSIKHPQKL